jgi:hypothetical protein
MYGCTLQHCMWLRIRNWNRAGRSDLVLLWPMRLLMYSATFPRTLDGKIPVTCFGKLKIFLVHLVVVVSSIPAVVRAFERTSATAKREEISMRPLRHSLITNGLLLLQCCTFLCINFMFHPVRWTVQFYTIKLANDVKLCNVGAAL